VQQQQSKLNKINKEIELLTDAITKAKVSIKTAERCAVCMYVQTHYTENNISFRNTKKGVERISSLEQEIVKNEQKVSEIKVLH